MCRTSNVLVRLPVAVFSLAFRKSMPMPWSGCVLPMTPCETPYIYARIRMPPAYVLGSIINIPPVKSCRRRRHFSPQMRVNRFVFLNLPILSHGDHLGVTTSPQSPFPTGYVTLPVDDRLPPLGLIPLHSKGQAVQFPPFFKHSRHMHPDYPVEAHCRRCPRPISRPAAPP